MDLLRICDDVGGGFLRLFVAHWVAVSSTPATVVLLAPLPKCAVRHFGSTEAQKVLLAVTTTGAPWQSSGPPAPLPEDCVPALPPVHDDEMLTSSQVTPATPTALVWTG